MDAELLEAFVHVSVSRHKMHPVTLDVCQRSEAVIFQLVEPVGMRRKLTARCELCGSTLGSTAICSARFGEDLFRPIGHE